MLLLLPDLPHFICNLLFVCGLLFVIKGYEVMNHYGLVYTVACFEFAMRYIYIFIYIHIYIYLYIYIYTLYMYIYI